VGHVTTNFEWVFHGLSFSFESSAEFSFRAMENGSWRRVPARTDDDEANIACPILI
jgi:hypothetical protein